MRDFKFRAWDGKKFWWNGFCITSYGNIQKNDISREYHSFKDENWILNQYTGLKDKNGKEIYEGDIIDVGHGNIYICEFRYGEFRLYSKNSLKNKNREEHYSISTPAFAHDSPIIGNIYENPDLLEKIK